MSDAHPATGARCVDILRHAVELPTEVANGLRLWVAANQLPDGHGWPLRIDWPERGITYWPADLVDGDPPFTQTLMQIPRGRLWQALADAGALWCADPAHVEPWPAPPAACSHRVDHAGEHRIPRTESRPNQEGARADGCERTDGPLELLITRALERVGPQCDHPDPGQPIYDHTRACAACGAAAVIELFHAADVLELFRRRHVPMTVQRYAYPPGHVGPVTETLTPQGWRRTD